MMNVVNRELLNGQSFYRVTPDSVQLMKSAAVAHVTSIEEAAEIYADYLDASERTVQAYIANLKQFVKWMGAHGITRPTREDIIEWREELKADHKPATVQAYIIAVRKFFSWAEQQGIYPNIAENVKGAKVQQGNKKDYLTGKQVAAVLQGIDRSTAKGIRDYAIVLLMVTGGLRDIEVSRANIEDLHTLGGVTVLDIQGKGRDDRAEFIKVTEEAEQALRAYLATRETAAGSEPLFTSVSHNNAGQRITTKSISTLVKHYLKAAGLNSPRLTAHSLRHTAVTISLLAGCSLEEVQQFARHSSINTTMIYAHNLQREQSKCESSIAAAIFGGYDR